MDQSTSQPSREQQMYWSEFNQLKADACYVRDYRNSIGRWVTAFATIRALTSTSSIGAWLVWKRYAFVWAGLIVASQLIDALKDVFPLYKRRRSLSRWSRTLNLLFVEAQKNWDEIAGGQCTDTQIRKLCHQLRSRKQRAETKHIPDGLKRREDLFALAQIETQEFFTTRYTF